LLALLLPLAAGAQEILLDFRSEPLPRVVETIARETGERFIHDDTLRGSVTISVPQRVSREEALAVLDAALLLHGFAALPGPNRVRRIVRIEDAAGSAPWLAGPPGRGSEAAVTTLIRLQAASAAEVEPALRQLIGKGAVLARVEQSNSILIAASEATVRRLLHLVRALDQASRRELRVLPLRYRDVASIEPLLEEALADEDGLGDAVRVIGDERTASLVVEGRRADIERVRALLRTLDLPLPGKRDLHVVRVLNTDAEKLAESLDALAQDGAPTGKDPREIPVQIVVDNPTHSLVIRASHEKFAELAAVIAELDIPPPRVSIELAVVEASFTGDLTLGFDSLLGLGGIPNDLAELQEEGIIVLGTGTPENLIDRGSEPASTDRFFGRVTSDPLIVPVIDPTTGLPQAAVLDFGGQIRADAGEGRFHTVIRPHLLMTSGDEHHIQAGDNVPVPVSTGGAVGADGTTVPTFTGVTTDVTFQRQDTGVDLRMTPTVLSEVAVALQLELTISELESTSEELGPTITKRDVSAQVRLRDGEIALIAALRAPQRSETRVGVPFLSRIPILGQFLTVRQDIQRRRALIVTAQPTVLGSPADELARSIRQRLAFERQLARTRPLAGISDAPYALLIDTRDDRATAETVAGELSDPRWQVRLAPWTSDSLEHWDIYVTGFRTLGEASQASIELRDSGWQPQLTVLTQMIE
jgi:general secretion pathway protein D